MNNLFIAVADVPFTTLAPNNGISEYDAIGDVTVIPAGTLLRRRLKYANGYGLFEVSQFDENFWSFYNSRLNCGFNMPASYAAAL